MNKLMPGCIKKIDKKGGGFALMQNIERFQDAAKAYGVPVTEVFQTVDLWERKNIPQVTQCIFALGRTVRENTLHGQIQLFWYFLDEYHGATQSYRSVFQT
jgi:hypothetical protein